MNCIEHEDREAVSTCANCGAGLCKECDEGSFYRSNNGQGQAFCKKCNYEIVCENDRSLNSALKSKFIFMYFYIAAVAIGLIFFVVRFIIGYDIGSSIIGTLLIWACGSFVGLFDPTSVIRSVLSNLNKELRKNFKQGSFIQILFGLIGTILGSVLGFLILGLGSPFIIIAYLIGISKVKKQIAENNAILSQFGIGNNQS
jgi:hypothetical protein